MSESIRRLQARKMPKTRARRVRFGDSATEMTGSKSESTVTEPAFEFTFCKEGVTSDIDRVFSTFEGQKHSPIYISFEARSVDFMVSKILEKPPGFKAFITTAKLRMKAFLKFVEEEVWISNEDEKSLLREVWLDPCFFGSLAAAIDYNNDIVHLILSHLPEDTVDVAARVDRMKADPNFVNSVRGLKKRTSRRTFLRLFLSILLSFWGDEVLLRELEQKMGKKVFGRRLDMMAKMRARMAERAGKEDEFEYFSYVIEDINHANDVEPLRKQMVEKYAGREDRDIEALLKQIDLFPLLSITHDHLGYDGKKVKINVDVINGFHCGISIETLPSNEKPN